MGGTGRRGAIVEPKGAGRRDVRVQAKKRGSVLERLGGDKYVGERSNAYYEQRFRETMKRPEPR